MRIRIFSCVLHRWISKLHDSFSGLVSDSLVLFHSILQKLGVAWPTARSCLVKCFVDCNNKKSKHAFKQEINGISIWLETFWWLEVKQIKTGKVLNSWGYSKGKNHKQFININDKTPFSFVLTRVSRVVICVYGMNMNVPRRSIFRFSSIP